MLASKENGDIWKRMADFDFKASIKATVIFDDAEEDINRFIETVVNNNDSTTKKLDKIVSEIVDDICKMSHNNEHESLNTNKKGHKDVLREPQISKKRKLINNETKESNNEYLCAITSLNNQSQTSLNIQTEISLINHAEIELNNHAETSLNSQAPTSFNDHAEISLNNQSQTSLNSQSQISLNNQANTSLKNIDVSPDNIGLSFYQKQDELNKKNSECLKAILNTVSMHMIQIMNAYIDYAKIAERNDLKKKIDAAKKHYMLTKGHFFYLSYSAVINIIIPQENNEVFVKNFIEDTVKLSNDKHYYFTHMQMQALYKEMIGWVKSQRRKEEDAINHHSGNPVLTGLLQKPPPLQQRNYPMSANYYGSANHAVRPSNNRQPNVHITPNVSIRNPTQQYNNTMQSVPAQNIPSSQTYVESSKVAQSNIPPGYYLDQLSRVVHNIPPGQTAEQTSRIVQNISSEHIVEKLSRVHNIQSPEHTSTQPSTSIRNYIQEFQTFQLNYQNYQESELPVHKRPVNRAKPRKQTQHQVLTPPPIHTETVPTSITHFTVPDLSRPPPAYPSSWNNAMPPQNCSENLMISPHSNTNFHQDSQAVEANRSLSRDSGFMSPSALVSNDPMCSPRHDRIEESTSSLSPMITHVTSLNPSVAYMKDGSCHVCSRPTNQKCLGCYKTYYCSTDCQSHDWKSHIYVCHK